MLVSSSLLDSLPLNDNFLDRWSHAWRLVLHLIDQGQEEFRIFVPLRGS